ncbi:MAG: adenylate/guanylate cyclase domain-containing protein, partial [Candidatus Rokuibacteriota bacterium]
EVLEIVLRAMDGVLDFTHTMILLKDLADDVLRVAATRGYADQGTGAPVGMGEGVIGVVGERRKMMRIGNIGASMRYLKSVRARMEAAGQVGPAEATASLPGLADAQSQLALPLTVKDRLVGVLAVESRKPNAFDELDEVLLRIVGNQAATAIDNARTYQMVEQLGRLKRFFSPQLAELIIRGGADDPLKTHRREVTVVFLDLRGFTAFAETSEPEELMGVLREYHAEMGKLILAHEGTLERFTGDGMMIFFNDPLPVPDAAERAVRMAVAMRERAAELAARWHRSGYELDLGIGVAKGFATIGAIGFEGRWDYGAIGTVTNLAARLCGEAKPGQILISPRLLPEVEQLLEIEDVGVLAVKGLARPVKALNIVRLRDRA